MDGWNFAFLVDGRQFLVKKLLLWAAQKRTQSHGRVDAQFSSGGESMSEGAS